ncbi:DUF4292 domain-containing protein [Nonlabens ponticola]|uniref:DUF4292 domain-containing protein n=1 Tax=Nonlabens ponticola TaxID=2496866 RepID=A0A3S9MVU4_9FLAO|nr:DUF4292 domain-containing protein [Nonlabens ponticola]AZQ43233.1 DUF4292 domain-containing protein [Nonlabens ponticola]
MRLKSITYIAIALIITACGTSRLASEDASTTAAKTKIINSHNNAAINFTTMQSRLRVRFQNPDQNRSVSVDLRMKQGEHIWMSARILGITLAKVSITPDRVQFYEKLNNRSFDGDFSIISEFLGEELNYQQLENLLLGQAFEPLNNLQYSVIDNEYQFKSKQGTIEKLFMLRPADFKTSRQSVVKSDENSSLDARYPQYQMVDNKIIPLELNINANQKGKLTRVELEFNNVEFGQDLSFPFSMPSNTRPYNF